MGNFALIFVAIFIGSPKDTPNNTKSIYTRHLTTFYGTFTDTKT